MNDLPEHDEDSGGATQAFEDLRAEMSVLRRAVEALPAAWSDNQPPDYSPDLVRLNKGLASVTNGLAAIEQHPALRQSPDQHEAAVARAGNALMREASQKPDTATMWATRVRPALGQDRCCGGPTTTKNCANHSCGCCVCSYLYDVAIFAKYHAVWL